VTKQVRPRRATPFGLAAAAIGVAHFAVPSAFDGINARMFPADPRAHVYVNGAVETVLGAACLAAGLRPAVKVGYGIYAAYLVTNLLRTIESGRSSR
jgi:uncharacterized membrane protein